MKSIFLCAMADALRIASVDIRNGDHLFGPLDFYDYIPPIPHPLPYVPAYLQDYEFQPKLLKDFLRSDACKGIYRHCDYLVALPDDCTDLETNAIHDLCVSVGAKRPVMEYQAFLLSADTSYLAVTASKRAVCVTHVIAKKDETDRVFIPINLLSEDTLYEALSALDSEHTLPVYTFGLPDEYAEIGREVPTQTLVKHLAKLL